MTTPSPVNPVVNGGGGAVPSTQPASSDSQVRALAMQLTAMASTPPPLTLNQGTIVDVAPDATPPTCSVTLSGSGTQIDGVSYLDGYTPFLGDTVAILRQNASPLVIGHVADLGTASASTGGWTQATLFSGSFTHGGNSNGNLMYRKVMDHGAWKMQWKGAVAVTGSPVTVAVLDTSFAPAVKTSVIASRNVKGVSESIDFQTNGHVELTYDITHASNNQNIGSVGSGDNSDSNSNHLDGSGVGHAHHHAVSFDHFHEIDFVAPSWVSFNGVEYFL